MCLLLVPLNQYLESNELVVQIYLQLQLLGTDTAFANTSSTSVNDRQQQKQQRGRRSFGAERVVESLFFYAHFMTAWKQLALGHQDQEYQQLAAAAGEKRGEEKRRTNERRGKPVDLSLTAEIEKKEEEEEEELLRFFEVYR